MSHIKDGGQAFPGDRDMARPGMSLRDYFAGEALAQIAMGGVNLDRNEQKHGERIRLLATYCYEMADAMLEAKETRP